MLRRLAALRPPILLDEVFDEAEAPPQGTQDGKKACAHGGESDEKPQEICAMPIKATQSSVLASPDGPCL